MSALKAFFPSSRDLDHMWVETGKKRNREEARHRTVRVVRAGGDLPCSASACRMRELLRSDACHKKEKMADPENGSLLEGNGVRGFKRQRMGAFPIAWGWLQLQSERRLKLLSNWEAGSLNDDSG